MNNIMKSVLTVIGVFTICIGLLTGGAYFGFKKGISSQVGWFHVQCKKTTLLQFKNDSVEYICTPPPKAKKGVKFYDTI